MRCNEKSNCTTARILATECNSAPAIASNLFDEVTTAAATAPHGVDHVASGEELSSSPRRAMAASLLARLAKTTSLRTSQARQIVSPWRRLSRGNSSNARGPPVRDGLAEKHTATGAAGSCSTKDGSSALGLPPRH